MKMYNFGRRGTFLVIYGFLVILLSAGVSGTIQVALDFFVDKGFDSVHMLSLMTFGSIGTLVVLFFLNFVMVKKTLSFRKLGLFLGLAWGILVATWGIISNQTLFTVVYIAAFLCSQVIPLVVVNNIVNNWFPRKRGIVMGIITIGFTLGAIAGIFAFTALLNVFGFVGSYIFFGILIIAITILGYVLLRDNPEEAGCTPDNDKTMTPEEAKRILSEGAELSKNSPWTLSRVIGTWQTWAISIVCGFCMLVTSGISSQLVVRLTTEGYAQMQATMFMAIAGLVGCVGSWLMGIVDQKIGPRRAMIALLIVIALGCGLNALGQSPLMIVSVVLLGIEMGGSSNFTMSLTSYYFGRYNFGKVYGTILVIVQFIGAFGAAYMANVGKAFSYNTAFMILAVISIICIFIIAPVKEDFVKNKEKTFK